MVSVEYPGGCARKPESLLETPLLAKIFIDVHRLPIPMRPVTIIEDGAHGVNDMA